MQDIIEKAKNIELVIFDIDGVMTDGSLFFDNHGGEYKAFHSLDGHGLRMLQECGVKVAVITGRKSELVKHRMNDLGVTLLYQGYRDKTPAFAALLKEVNLEKDQILLNLQLLLGNLHYWARTHYFAQEWQRLELKTATELIYRKAGWVQWGTEQIEVLLEPYRYPEHQQAMEETCRRFNAANIHWRDGRRLRIQVAPL